MAHNEQTFDALIGHRIKSLWLNDEDEELWIETDGSGGRGSRYLCYQTGNDCCNRVWFCYFNFLGKVFNSKVVKTLDHEWEDLPKEQYVGGDDDEEKIMFTINTKGGRLDIEVRNSNNGYYGGTVNFRGVHPELPSGIVRVTEMGREPILNEENIDV